METMSGAVGRGDNSTPGDTGDGVCNPDTSRVFCSQVWRVKCLVGDQCHGWHLHGWNHCEQRTNSWIEISVCMDYCLWWMAFNEQTSERDGLRELETCNSRKSVRSIQQEEVMYFMNTVLQSLNIQDMARTVLSFINVWRGRERG